MRVRSLTLVLLLCLPQIALASNGQSEKPRAAEEPPDAELLEFIAEFEPLDGQWIDPIQLNMIFADSRNGKEND
ncbi:MAG: hypothetical protein JSW45_11800 [Thiotrichales bacterium]|nr:MAG: hypothetical protein JSW45_11800 [Thiotrichales bacterium]